jgi:hypothetical protein
MGGRLCLLISDVNRQAGGQAAGSKFVFLHGRSPLAYRRSPYKISYVLSNRPKTDGDLRLHLGMSIRVTDARTFNRGPGAAGS